MQANTVTLRGKLLTGGSIMSESIFNLASRHAEWVAQRRTVLATNIAHANTLGYRANDVSSFEGLLLNSGPSLTQTNSRHLAPTSVASAADTEEVNGAGAQHSGNTVDLEREMLKTAEVARAHALNVAVVRAFHRMSLSSVKG
jgi:flagellar basal-body rod protein FlgB